MSRKSLGTGETLGTGPRHDPSRDVPIGTMVGEYRIEGLLGEGGMGRVYAAVHPVIAKRAAIKVLHAELSVNRQAVERFVQEARAVNQIGHPNIVDIFAFGALADGRCYFVMEHLRGQSLRTRIDAELPAMAETLAIIDSITIALEAAHEKNIIHRDLKPDNIFLVDVKGERPTVKLLDFGIAKLLGTDESRVSRTRTGNVLGTPAYISPEQARGMGVDHRTDIYALGALAYDMLTGQLPYPADNAADMIAKHLYQPVPSVRALDPTVPPELDVIIQQMLSKDAAHRPTLPEVRERMRACRLMLTNQLARALPSQVQRPHAGLLTTVAPDAPRAATQQTLPDRRSRGWLYAALVGATAVAAGVVVAIVIQDKRAATDPIDPIAPAAIQAPAPKPDIKAPVVEPIDEPPPVEAEPPEPPVVEPEDPPPAVDDDKPATAKQPRPVKKPAKPLPSTTKKPKVDDDDAPM